MESGANGPDIGYVPDDPDDEISEVRKAAADVPPSPAGSSSAPTTTEAAPAVAQTAAIEAERDEYKDKYLRTLAEMDNFRKRMKKEKSDYQKYVFGDFLLDLLPVLDNLERALKSHGAEDDRGIAEGVEIIRRQFVEQLKKYRVVEIEALGKEFDPTFHQALSRAESKEVAVPTVIEVYQKGYLYHDRLLRPALTKVVVPMERDTVIEQDE